MAKVRDDRSITGRDGYIMAQALYVASKALRSKEFPEWSNAADMEAIAKARFPKFFAEFHLQDRVQEGLRLGLAVPDDGLSLTHENVEAWIAGGTAKKSILDEANVPRQTDINVEEFRQTIKEQFENALFWRSEKAIKYPNDSRNNDAKIYLVNLRETLCDVPSLIIVGLVREYDRRSEEEAHQFFEKMSEALRAVGFYDFPANATIFCERLISGLR